MTGRWTVASEAEKRATAALMAKFFSGVTDIPAAMDVFNHHINEILDEIDHPKMVVAPQDDTISNHMIAQLAYAISEQIRCNHSNGVVFTPHALAKDMVRMGLIEWLAINSPYPRAVLYNFVCGGEKQLLSDTELVRQLATLKWYDPCVGGGVFPTAIIEVLTSIGIQQPPCIYGVDLNALYIAATKVRVALTMDGPFEANRKAVDAFFHAGDALDAFLPPPNRPCCESDGFDIVVGNPPYVGAGKIEPTAKERYVINYPHIRKKTADLYIYFIAHGLNALKRNGVLTYVSPAQFQMSHYGKAIREDIQARAGLLTIVDFNELPVFKNIGAHISVYSLGKHYKPDTFLRWEHETLPEQDPLMRVYTEGTPLAQKNASAAGWNFSSHSVHDILALLSQKGVPLKAYSGGVYSGLKCGCKKAFWLTEAETEALTAYDWQFVQKMYIPQNIRRWFGEWSGEYFAIIKKGQLLDESSLLFHRMLAHKDALSSRRDVQNHATWYGLRGCSYYDALWAPKILYPEIATECRFMMDRVGLCIPDGAFFIPKEDYYLLGLLNSCIGRYYFKEKCARIGNPQKGGRIRFKKVYVEDFPVVLPQADTKTAQKIDALARKATNLGALDESEARKLDDWVLQLYQIPNQYREILKDA